MRWNVLLAVLLTTSACAGSSTVSPSQGTWKFSGNISALDGTRPVGPIAGAELTVIEGVNLNAKVTTDAAGNYVFPSLDSGRFTVAIAKPGFVSATPVVDLYHDTEVNFALQPK